MSDDLRDPNRIFAFSHDRLEQVVPVAAAMVGMDRKKENSRAEARDMPAS